MEHLRDILNALAAIFGLTVFLVTIGYISRCDSERERATSEQMMECARRQCNWLQGSCFCSIQEKK